MRKHLAFGLALALTGVVAAEKVAEAAPIVGQKTYGKNFQRSSYKGDFGASFEAGANAYARDYAQLCASTAPAVQCTGPMASGFMGNICKAIWQPINTQYCAKNVGTKMGFGAYGGTEADVRLFGKDLEIFDLSADAKIEPNEVSTGYGIYVAGIKLSGKRYGAEINRSVPLAERTLVRATGDFMLGPVPVTVSASAVGSLGIDFNLAAGTAQVSATVEPYAEVDGVFSAGVGTSFASVGIEGELLLARVGIPGSATVVWQGGRAFQYNASLDLTLRTLDGSVSLYGQVAGYKKSLEITSWDGLNWSWNLGSAQGNFNL